MTVKILSQKSVDASLLYVMECPFCGTRFSYQMSDIRHNELLVKNPGAPWMTMNPVNFNQYHPLVAFIPTIWCPHCGMSLPLVVSGFILGLGTHNDF